MGCSSPSVQLLGMLRTLGCCTQCIPGKAVLECHSMAHGKSKISWILPATGRFSRTVCDYIKQHKVTFALAAVTQRPAWMQRPAPGKTSPPHSAGSPSFRQDREEHVGAPVPAETLDWLRKALPGPVLVCH